MPPAIQSWTLLSALTSLNPSVQSLIRLNYLFSFFFSSGFESIAFEFDHYEQGIDSICKNIKSLKWEHFSKREKHWNCVQWSLDIINDVWFPIRSVSTFHSLPFWMGQFDYSIWQSVCSPIDSWRAAKKNYLPFANNGKRKIFSFVSTHLKSNYKSWFRISRYAMTNPCERTRHMHNGHRIRLKWKTNQSRYSNNNNNCRSKVSRWKFKIGKNVIE